MWKPSSPRSVIKVSDCGYGLSLCRALSHLEKGIRIQKVPLSLIRGSTTLKERDLMKT